MASILLICTGNICRSPMAEGFLRVSLEHRLGPDAPRVSSAGVIGRDGATAVPEAVRAASDRGVDISGHVARRLLGEHVEAADLLLGMATEHREEIAAAVPAAAFRTFTLKELVRLLEALPPTTPGHARLDERLASRVAEADGLRRSGFAGNPNDEDVVDPLGMPFETFRAIAWEIDEWCERLAGRLFGAAVRPGMSDSPSDVRAMPATHTGRATVSIRTTCPRDGGVEVAAPSILVSFANDGGGGTYRFTCPVCHQVAERRVDRASVALLVASGADVSNWPDGHVGEGAGEG